jgi:hypothetical protein
MAGPCPLAGFSEPLRSLKDSSSGGAHEGTEALQPESIQAAESGHPDSGLMGDRLKTRRLPR